MRIDTSAPDATSAVVCVSTGPACDQLSGGGDGDGERVGNDEEEMDRCSGATRAMGDVSGCSAVFC